MLKTWSAASLMCNKIFQTYTQRMMIFLGGEGLDYVLFEMGKKVRIHRFFTGRLAIPDYKTDGFKNTNGSSEGSSPVEPLISRCHHRVMQLFHSQALCLYHQDLLLSYYHYCHHHSHQYCHHHINHHPLILHCPK